MHIVRVMLFCFLAPLLASCASSANIHSRTSMTADVLKPINCREGVPLDLNCAHGQTDLEKVHDLVQDSEQKCSEFVVGMFASNAKTSTYLDVAATSFTAIATVFTPINTVHALTAAGTVASGTKTSIQNNYLNALTLSHVVQAVQTSYSSKMADYIGYLAHQKEVDVYAERSTILAIHGLCSLPQAEGTIQATLSQGTGSSPASPMGPLSFIYTVSDADADLAKLAANFADEFSNNAAMKDAGLYAKPSASNKTDINIILDADKLSGVTWKQPELRGAMANGKTADSSVRASFSNSTTLSFGGTPKAGETIMIKTDVISPARRGSAPPKVLYGAPTPSAKKA